MRQIFAAALLLAAPLGSAASASESPGTDPGIGPLLSFEFLGCSDDWRSDRPAEASVWRVTADDRVTFLVRHPGTCGLTGQDPSFRYTDGSLLLDYAFVAPDDSVSMCECEYWAKFTFGETALRISKVQFAGWPTVLLGSWPSER